MYIYCNSKPIKTFVRFGKRLSHGKSVNYLAMNPRIKEIYSVKLAELQYGYITEEEFNAWCEDALDSFVWEPHISCFEMDPKTQLPVVKNVSQAKTLIGFIQRFEDKLPCQAFLVRGIQTGTGTDQEPLVDVTEETEIAYDIEDLILAKHEIDLLRIDHKEISERSVLQDFVTTYALTNYIYLINDKQIPFNYVSIYDNDYLFVTEYIEENKLLINKLKQLRYDLNNLTKLTQMELINIETLNNIIIYNGQYYN